MYTCVFVGSVRCVEETGVGAYSVGAYSEPATDFGAGLSATSKGSGGLQCGGLQCGGLQCGGLPMSDLPLQLLARVLGCDSSACYSPANQRVARSLYSYKQSISTDPYVTLTRLHDTAAA